MTLDLTRHDAFAVLTLTRPEARNALNAAMLDALDAAFDTVATMDVHALILTGAGTKAFCAGADLTQMTGLDADTKRRKSERGQRVMARLDTLPVPSVALLNGAALGGGLELAMAATFRIATPNATLGQPEIRLGLIPGHGGTQRLPRLVGEARALEMILTGRPITAAEALAIGLVNRVTATDNPLAEAMDFARGFTGHSPAALLLARDAVRAAHALPLAEGLAIEADLSTRAYLTPHAQNGIAAFLARGNARQQSGTDTPGKPRDDE